MIFALNITKCVYRRREYENEVLKDFMLIDYSIIKSAISKIDRSI